MGARKALVIGGGIGGLAAAIGLRRAGWEVEVFEAAPEMREVGAGLSIWINALKAMDRLGLRHLAPSAMPDGPSGFWTPAGELLSGMDAAEMRSRHGEMMAVVHRAELQAGMLDALGREHVRAGVRLVRFDQDPGGVTAIFGDGSEARGDVLIGADGIRSVVRSQLHGPEAPRYAGYTAWRAVVPFAHDRLKAGETIGRGARFGRVAMAGGRVYWFATQNAAEGGRSPDGEKAELLRVFAGWHAPIPQLIAAAPEESILRNDIHDRPPLAKWGAGRVTLLGDAAHPMTPNLGQGACQALEDAVALARALGESTDVEAALARYEEIRRPRANRFVRQSRALGRVLQWRNPAAVGLRDALFRHALPRLQPRQMAEMAAYEP